jgi:hypothetical protein
METTYTLPSSKSPDFFEKMLIHESSKTSIKKDDHPVIDGTSVIPEWLRWVPLPEISDESRISLVSSTGKVSIYAYLHQEKTAITSLNSEMTQLAMAASEENESLFVTIANLIDWDSRPVENYLTAIQLALRIGAHLKARELALAGGKCFPENPEMAKYARILAPVRTIRSDLPSNPEASSNMQWLKSNQDKFRGRWVAIKNGKLITAAENYQQIRQMVGSTKNTGILIIKV